MTTPPLLLPMCPLGLLSTRELETLSYALAWSRWCRQTNSMVCQARMQHYLLREGVIGRAKVLTRRVTFGVRFEYKKVLESDFVDQTHPIVTDRTRHRVWSNLPFALLSWECDRMCRSREWSDAPVTNPRTSSRAPAALIQHPVQRPVTPVTSCRLCFFASDVVGNRRFTSTKVPNPVELARMEGERNPNPSLPLKLHLLHKCANTTKCSPSYAHVLAFSQIFSQGVSISLDPKCICSRILTMIAPLDSQLSILNLVNHFSTHL
jgi:hypothetical protein